MAFEVPPAGSISVVKRAHLIPCIWERETIKHRTGLGVSLANEVLNVGESHNGPMKRGGLGRNRSFVGVADGLQSGAERHHGLEASVKNDGVISMAQRFESIYQGFGPRLGPLEQCHGVLNKTPADGDGGTNFRLFRELNAMKQALDIRQTGRIALVEQPVFEQGNGGLE